MNLIPLVDATPVQSDCRTGQGAATYYGTGIDNLIYDGPFVAVVYSNITASTGATVDWSLQDSADNSTFNAVTGTSAVQNTGVSKTTQLVALGDIGDRARYVRSAFVLGGTITADISCCFLFQKKRL